MSDAWWWWSFIDQEVMGGIPDEFYLIFLRQAITNFAVTGNVAALRAIESVGREALIERGYPPDQIEELVQMASGMRQQLEGQNE